MGCIIEQYPNSKLWTKLLEIEADVQDIIHERLSCTQNSPSLAGTGETIRFYVSVIDNDTGPIAEDKIVAGTYDLIQIRNSIETTIVDDGAFSKRDGFIYTDIDFDSATWDLDDSYILIPNQNSTAEISGTIYHLPLSAWSGMILDLSSLEAAVNTIISTIGTPAGVSIAEDIADIEAKLDNGTFGLAALNADLDALLADVGDASGSGLGSIYSILGNPAQTFTAMVGYEGAASLATKLTAARAGYLDNINNAQLLNIPDLSTLTAARIGYLDNINTIITTLGAPAGASIAVDIADIEAKLDDGTYGLEALEVNQQGTAADGGISDGSVYYVSLNGDNSTGLTWATAMNTIDAAVGLCTADNGDVIFVAPGTYNENANGAAGVTCDKIGITIRGVSIGVNVTNTDNTNGGYVFNITADRTVLEDLKVYKGEVVSTGSTCVNVNADGVRILGTTTDVEKAGFTGIKVLNGSVGTRIRGHERRGQIFSTNAVGTGIDIDGTMADVCDVSVRQLTVGIELGANSDNNVINDTVTISDCATGVHLSAGAQSNTINALLAACTTIFNDASGNATNDRHSSLTHIHQDIAHVPKHTGALHFVDGTNGSDNNTGHSPEEAFATVNAAITAAAAGDRIYVRAGSYSEAGFNLNEDGLELVCENGTLLSHSGAGTVVTISNPYCRIENAIITEAGQIGIDIAAAASFSDIKDCVLFACGVGIDINSLRNVITNCRSLLCTTTGFDIANGYNQLENCTAAGLGGGSRGYYLSAAAADHNHMTLCHSINNVTAGFEVVAGANNNVIDNCSTGGGDGAKVDGGTNNTWANFTEGSQITAGQSRDQDLKDIFDDTTAVLADVGDASASDLGSLYNILGNPAAAISAMIDMAMRPSLNLYEGWQDETGIDTTVWTASGAAWSRGASGAYLRATSSPATAETARLITDQRWIAAPDTYGTDTILRRLVLEFEMRLTDVTYIDEEATFFGWTKTTADTRASDDIIGFYLDASADDLYSLTDNGGVETTNDTGIDAADLASWHKYKIDIYEGNAKFYVDEALKTTHTTNLPDYPMYLDFFIENDGGAGSLTIELGVVRVWTEDIAR